MADILHEIARMAADAVAMSENRDGRKLDYTQASLGIVEELLDDATDYADEMSPEQLTMLVEIFGCYIIEVARREFGGTCYWYDERNQPVFVVGEPNYRIALVAWDKVRGRLSGDSADNIPFFYSGFAERARKAQPGDDAMYV